MVHENNLISDDVKSQNLCPRSIHDLNERRLRSCDKVDNLFSKIVTYDNILLAWRKTEKLRRYRKDIILFREKLDENLLNILNELKNNTYKVSEYKFHTVYEPKKRIISSLPIKDRVVQHAIMNILEPIIDKQFIFESHACRKGHGVKLAVDRALKFAKKNDYVLKCDISKFYDSINQDKLFNILSKKIKCKDTLNLLNIIIKSYNKGVPIGNLTSQFFGNLYLHELDFYMKFTLLKKYYIRYMDDFLIFDNNINELKDTFNTLEKFLNDLDLKIHDKKRTIYKIENSFPFCGSKIFKTHTVLLQTTIRKNRKKIRKLANKLITINKVKPMDFINYIESIVSHSVYSRNFSYRKSLMEAI